jgi:thiamine kinase-like enzyme
MIFKRTLAFLMVSFVSLQMFAFGQTDEQIIRDLFEKTTGQTAFSLNVIPLKEGLTNRNYKAIFNGTPFFVRLGNENPESLKINRSREILLYSIAAKDGIAPKLLYWDSTSGTLIEPFLQGTPYGKKKGTWLYDRTESIQRIAALLQRAHAHESPGPKMIDYPFQIIYDYIEQAHSLSIPLPQDIDHVLDIVQHLQDKMPEQKKVLCHQDLVPDNFIFDGKTLYLIDWEYATWSDPFYDFASLCIEHEFDDEEKDLLLKDSFQTPTEEQRIHLEMMCMLYSLRDSLWYFLENEKPANQSKDFQSLGNYYYQKFYTSLQWLEEHNVALET